ncbi:serine hydrolase domain-containing protein [Gorillibacterium timonense]|uniref:serine hydrolase domain-containing protein n=1 Tax=Gorillibacterium timonense TaxID=1689269 RepID=UPI00071E4780|nr:serine hydrolase domain-containing protein [Gorillibacterium timonense]
MESEATNRQTQFGIDHSNRDEEQTERECGEEQPGGEAIEYKHKSGTCRMDELEEDIRSILEKHQVVGLAAAAIDRNGVVWSGEWGWRNLEKGLPVTEDTVFRIASVSKTVVAAAFLQQVERGCCRLEQDIGDILGYPVRNPRYPDKPITALHLMTHTSGIQDHYADFVVATRSESPPRLKLEELLLPAGRYYTDALWGEHEPGSPHGFTYSNVGAIILATMVEKLTFQRFDLYCLEQLFDPLGMLKSSFSLDHFDNLQEISVLYEYSVKENRFQPALDDYSNGRPALPDLEGYRPGTNAGLFSPQGGLRTTMRDLIRFLDAFLFEGAWEGARILSEESIRRMRQAEWTGWRNDGFFRNSGLQLHLTDDLLPGIRLYGHAGDAYGLLSDFYYEPEEGWGFCFAMNGLVQAKTGGVYYAAEEEIARLLYEKILSPR